MTCTAGCGRGVDDDGQVCWVCWLAVPEPVQVQLSVAERVCAAAPTDPAAVEDLAYANRQLMLVLRGAA